MDENTTPEQSENSELPVEQEMPAVSEMPATQESPEEPASTPALNPDGTPPMDKKAKRKAMLKRLGIVGGIVYGVTLVFIFAWAAITGNMDIQTFDYLPISQAGFGNFLMIVFNVFWGLLVAAGLVVGTFGLIKMLLAKKDQTEKKKKGKKRMIIGGAGFVLLAILWIVGIWFLGPRLVTESRYSSGIMTEPTNTIGLTAPTDVIFDASEIPVDEDVYTVLAYTWNFGDGDTANGQTVSHRYTQKGGEDGRYTVTLNVDYMDVASGAQFDAEFKTEVVIENELVAASFTVSPDSGEIPLTVKFDASSSYDPDGEVIAYEWDLDGDGRFDDGEGEKVEYTYTQEGTFEASLRVTDNNGEYDVMVIDIESGSVGGLRAVISSEIDEDGYAIAGEKYEFDGELSQIRTGNITKYTWEFGDKEEAQSRTVTHTYAEAGVYTVRLTVTDADGNEDYTELDIQVVDEGTPPKAEFETEPQSMIGPVPFTLTFDASDSDDAEDDIVQYEWDFDNDDNVDDTGDVVEYTYTEIGTYEARLIVTDSAGNFDEEIQEVEVTEQGVIAMLEVSENNGEVPMTVDFDASSSTYDQGSIVSYSYDFGDGSEEHIGGSSVSYKYTSVGTFTAELTVTADDGETATDAVQIVIRPVSLTSCFTVNIDSGSAPLFLAVDPSCSQGTISSYEWNFGDGEVSFDRKPETHTYTEAGIYTITLEITGDTGIVDSFEKSVTVK